MRILLILSMLVSLSFAQFQGFGGGFMGWNKLADDGKGLLEEDASSIAHWYLNSTNPDTLIDLTGNKHNLTPSSGFDYANQYTNDAPKEGKAQSFDGVNDGFLANNWNGTHSEYTYEFIIKLASTYVADYIATLKCKYVSGYSNGFQFYPYHDKLYFRTFINTVATNCISTDIAEFEKRYIYLTITAGDSSNIYINGNRVGTANIASAVYIDSLFSIGIKHDMTTAAIKGDYSELLISDRAKTSSEIAETWNAIKEEF